MTVGISFSMGPGFGLARASASPWPGPFFPPLGARGGPRVRVAPAAPSSWPRLPRSPATHAAAFGHITCGTGAEGSGGPRRAVGDGVAPCATGVANPRGPTLAPARVQSPCRPRSGTSRPTMVVRRHATSSSTRERRCQALHPPTGWWPAGLRTRPPGSGCLRDAWRRRLRVAPRGSGAAGRAPAQGAASRCGPGTGGGGVTAGRRGRLS